MTPLRSFRTSAGILALVVFTVTVKAENTVMGPRDVARLATEAFRNGEAVAPEHAVPVYLRDNVAKKMATD